MQKLSDILTRLEPCKVLVAGDLLLDRYTIGQAKRVSPEAPVLVLQVESEEVRPGGAGNVMLNLLSLGAEVVAIGRVGKDPSGMVLKHLLEENGIETGFVVEEEGYLTPTKNRLIADRQQLTRVDHERNTTLSARLQEELIKQIDLALVGCSAIALSDYGKGFLTDPLIATLIQKGKALGIPVIVDPKGHHYQKYAGCTLIKPNKKEAIEVSPLKGQHPIEAHGEALLRFLDAEALLITLGEEGSALFKRNQAAQAFPVMKREVRDVTGAGDTVLAALTVALACGLSFEEAVFLGNIAAGLAVERFGCARISLSDISYYLLKEHHTSKIFDTSHLFALKAALKGKNYHLVHLKSAETLTTEFLSTLRQIKKSGELLLVHPETPQPALLEHLVCLEMVDGVLLGDEIDTLIELCPNKLISF